MSRTLSPALSCGDQTFRDFAAACQAAVDAGGDVQSEIARLTGDFAASWRMPDLRYMQLQPDADYASYLLYLSPASDLSIVLDIFMAGQAAVTHNHLSWGVFTCLEGTELERYYDAPADLSSAPVEKGSRLRPPGIVTLAAPEINAFHQVECAEGDRSVSLHLYGSDIGRIERHQWDGTEGRYRSFVGGYSNDALGLPVYLSTADVAARS